MSGTGPPSDLSDGLVRDVDRTADHLRRLTESRLRRPSAPGGPTVADAAHAVAQWLADAAALVQPVTHPASGHPVPRLADLAVGDQVAVTGRELVDALAETPVDGMPQPGVEVDRAALVALVAEAVDRLAAVRAAG